MGSQTNRVYFQPRKVEYYSRIEAEYEMGETPDFERCTVRDGYLLAVAHKVQRIDGRVFQITEAIIEEPSGKIKRVDYSMLIRFI